MDRGCSLELGYHLFFTFKNSVAARSTRRNHYPSSCTEKRKIGTDVCVLRCLLKLYVKTNAEIIETLYLPDVLLAVMTSFRPRSAEYQAGLIFKPHAPL